jgi:hypothetical protein
MNKVLTLFLLFLLPGFALAQRSASRDTSIRIFMIDFSYAPQLPAGDMAGRFGWNSNVGSGLSLKTKSNLFFNLSGYFLFGNQILEEGLLDHLRTSREAILGIDGKYADVRLFERGYHIAAGFGKLYPWIGPNENSGILFMLQAGFLQHKIKIDPIGNTVPTLNKEYRKGYDRLSNGLALTQSVRYVYIPHRSFFNFYAGLEITEAFTKNRRSFNFDTMTADDMSRLDILFGARFGIIIPINRKTSDYYYY